MDRGALNKRVSVLNEKEQGTAESVRLAFQVTILDNKLSSNATTACGTRKDKSPVVRTKDGYLVG